MDKLKQSIILIVIIILFVLLAFTMQANDFIYIIGLYVLFTCKMVLDSLDNF